MNLTVEWVENSSKRELIAFLLKHSDNTLFLLRNLQEYGTRLAQPANSGNFKLVRRGEKIVATFCLCRRGTLLLFTEEIESTLPLILKSCREESFEVELNGVIGEWSQADSLWRLLKAEGSIREVTFASKEILYRAFLDSLPCTPQPGVRQLQPEDYAQWQLLNKAYIEEMGYPNRLSESEEHREFIDNVKKKISWGLFADGELLSVANLNAYAFDLGQLGGVYTLPERRRKGYSRSVIKQLLYDCKELHKLRKLIIFTDRDNIAARKLYESLGVSRVGYFGLFFGK